MKRVRLTPYALQLAEAANRKPVLTPYADELLAIVEARSQRRKPRTVSKPTSFNGADIRHLIPDQNHVPDLLSSDLEFSDDVRALLASGELDPNDPRSVEDARLVQVLESI